MSRHSGSEGREGASSRYVTFTREAWRQLRGRMPPALTEADLAGLPAPGEQISPDEVTDVYLPLSRFVNRRFRAVRGARARTLPAAPFIVGVAGSVAVGKSTTARVLRALLARWPDHPRVDLVTTDGFLFPGRVLQERGLMARKGFPESYDLPRLLQFLTDLKAGQPEVTAPVYSHEVYDVLPGQHLVVRRPDILILEGLNVLQQGHSPSGGEGGAGVPDFLDCSIYVDADERHIEAWYVQRFMALRAAALQDRSSFFSRFVDLPDAEAEALARRIWREINAVNLREHILPTRERAHVILEKGPDHTVRRVRLRRP